MAEVRSIGRGGRHRPGPILFALSLCLLGAGCYSYTEISPAEVAPGSSVRIRLSQSPAATQTLDLAGGERVLRGTLLPPTSLDTLLCAVPLSNADLPSRGLRRTIPVPVVAVERLEVRKLQKGRTAATVAVAAVTAALVVNWAFDVALPDEPGGEPGGTNNFRRTLFHLHW